MCGLFACEFCEAHRVVESVRALDGPCGCPRCANRLDRVCAAFSAHMENVCACVRAFVCSCVRSRPSCRGNCLHQRPCTSKRGCCCFDCVSGCLYGAFGSLILYCPSGFFGTHARHAIRFAKKNAKLGASESQTMWAKMSTAVPPTTHRTNLLARDQLAGQSRVDRRSAADGAPAPVRRARQRSY